MKPCSFLKKHVLATIVVMASFLLVGVVYAGFGLYYGIDDAYAQWGAADMVIAHMRDHGGTWPRGWEGLRGYFEKGGGRVGGWSYTRFQSHVYIDFGADVEHLRKLSRESDTVPFDAIHATSVFGSQMGDGPNAMLYRYFRGEWANDSAGP